MLTLQVSNYYPGVKAGFAEPKVTYSLGLWVRIDALAGDGERGTNRVAAGEQLSLLCWHVLAVEEVLRLALEEQLDCARNFSA